MERDDAIADFIVLLAVAAVGYGAWRLWRRYSQPSLAFISNKLPTVDEIEELTSEFRQQFADREDFLKALDIPWDKKIFGKAPE